MPLPLDQFSNSSNRVGGRLLPPASKGTRQRPYSNQSYNLGEVSLVRPRFSVPIRETFSTPTNKLKLRMQSILHRKGQKWLEIWFPLGILRRRSSSCIGIL